LSASTSTIVRTNRPQWHPLACRRGASSGTVTVVARTSTIRIISFSLQQTRKLSMCPNSPPFDALCRPSVGHTFWESKPLGLPCRRSRRQSNTHPTCPRLPNTILRRLRGASRQACHAGGRAGRATHTPPVRDFQTPSAAKTGGVARKTARSTSRRRPCGSSRQACHPGDRHLRLSHPRPAPPAPEPLSGVRSQETSAKRLLSCYAF